MGLRNETIYTCDRCSAEVRLKDAAKGWRFVAVSVTPQTVPTPVGPLALCPTCADVLSAALKPVSS